MCSWSAFPLIVNGAGLTVAGELTDALCARRGTVDCSVSGSIAPETIPPRWAHLAIEQTWRRLADGERIALAVAVVPSDEAVGQIWLGVRPQPAVTGLGYWVVPEWRR